MHFFVKQLPTVWKTVCKTPLDYNVLKWFIINISKYLIFAFLQNIVIDASCFCVKFCFVKIQYGWKGAKHSDCEEQQGWGMGKLT